MVCDEWQVGQDLRAKKLNAPFTRGVELDATFFDTALVILTFYFARFNNFNYRFKCKLCKITKNIRKIAIR
jgi:hypothetical protein